jgi:hypothetical protein
MVAVTAASSAGPRDVPKADSLVLATVTTRVGKMVDRKAVHLAVQKGVATAAMTVE